MASSRKSAKKPKKAARPDPLAELRALIERAKSGDASVLPLLRQCLDLNPQLWNGPGEVALQAQAAWIGLIAGKDFHLRECIARRVNKMKEDLVGDSPTKLEALLAERVVSHWLKANCLDRREAQHPENSLKWAEFALKQQAQANKQFTAAVEALAKLRLLTTTKKIVVEVIQQQTLASACPVIPETSAGEMPAHCNGTAKANGSPVTTAGARFNGNRCNGRNRLAHVLNGHGRNGVAVH